MVVKIDCLNGLAISLVISSAQLSRLAAVYGIMIHHIITHATLFSHEESQSKREKCSLAECPSSDARIALLLGYAMKRLGS